MFFEPKECEADDASFDTVADEMLDLVARISDQSGDMEAHFNNSAKEFSELIAGDILATASANQSAWGDALTACFHVFGPAHHGLPDQLESQRKRDCPQPQ